MRHNVHSHPGLVPGSPSLFRLRVLARCLRILRVELARATAALALIDRELTACIDLADETARGIA